jgi:hypothetical protein
MRLCLIRIIGAAAGLAGMLSMPALAQKTEPAPSFEASRILPPELRSGAGWSVDETVSNDGLFNHYTLHAGEGRLAVVGTELLRVRAHELQALAKMEEIKKSDVYAKAAGQAAMKPVNFAKDLANKPGETLESTAEGAGKMISGIGKSLFGGGEKPKSAGGTAKTVLGVDAAKRKFAEQFAIDPYSTNELLQKRLDELAWTASAGNLTVGAAFGAVGGPVGGVARTAGMAGDARALLYTKTPGELTEINRGKLARMGIPDKLITAFLKHPKYSLTVQTNIVAALDRMKGLGDRRLLLEDAATSEDEDDSFTWQLQAELIAGYHAKVAKAAKLVNLGLRPAMMTSAGTLVIVIPSDYVAWTDAIDRGVEEAGSKSAQVVAGAKRKEAWFPGAISALARSKLEGRGWIVRDKAASKLGVS